MKIKVVNKGAKNAKPVNFCPMAVEYPATEK